MITILIITALIIVTLIAWTVLDPARPPRIRRNPEVDRLLSMD
jgi:hypothetical protein